MGRSTRSPSHNADAVSDTTVLTGQLQVQVMRVLWTAGNGTVEEVRKGLPSAGGAAYTTVQTVLNRLVDRGLASRVREGKRVRYQPVVTEEEHLCAVLDASIGRASPKARQTALARFLAQLDEDELSRLRHRIAELRRAKDAAV